MKITSASKKVLASALSAAMVVAFAPVVAFGAVEQSTAPTAKLIVKATDASGAPTTYEHSYYDTTGSLGAQKAVDASDFSAAVVVGTKTLADGSTVYTKIKDVSGVLKIETTASETWSGSAAATITKTGVEVQLLADVFEPIALNKAVTLDLNGFTVTNDEDGVFDSTEAAGNYDNGKTWSASYAKPAINVSAAATIKNGTVKAVSMKETASAPAKSAVAQDAITSSAAVTVEALTVEATDEAIVSTGNVAIMGGTYGVITATGKDITVGTAKKAVEVAAGKVAAKSLTVNKGSKVSATYKAVKATADESNPQVAVDLTDNATAGLTLNEGASLTVVASSDNAKQGKLTYTQAVAAKKIDSIPDGKLGTDIYQYAQTGAITGLKLAYAPTIAKDAAIDVSATSAGEDGSAVAIDATGLSITVGDKTANTGYAATLKAAASVSGDQSVKTATAAKGIVATKVTVENGTFEATANVADDANAVALDAAIDATSVKGAATVKAAALDDKKATAVSGNVEAAEGTYVGVIAPAKFQQGKITGGSYTTYPQNADKDAVNLNDYEIVDEGGMYTVKQFNGFRVKTSTTGLDAAVNNYINGKADAAGIALAEGVTLADLQAQCKASGDKQLTVIDLSKEYNKKKATEAEQAVYDAVVAYAKANLFIAEDIEVTMPKFVIGYYADDAAKLSKTPTVMGTITTLGTVTTGRTSEPVTMTLDAEATKADTVGKQVVTVSGTTVTAMPWEKQTDDTYAVKVNEVPTAYATLEVDQDAVKNAAEKGEEAAETITDPAVKAAIVALQDEVAANKATGASKTVKIGSKAKTSKAKSVTLKAVTSASGAKMTFKKASGSKYITLKGAKATLKKGVKKGTYTAKVTATVGASSKNVVVKFVVKK